MSWYSTVSHRTSDWWTTSPPYFYDTGYRRLEEKRFSPSWFCIMPETWGRVETLSWSTFVKTMMDRLHGQERLYTLMHNDLIPCKHLKWYIKTSQTYVGYIKFQIKMQYVFHSKKKTNMKMKWMLYIKYLHR